MQPQGVPSRAFTSEEALVTLTRNRLVPIIEKAVEEALAREGRRVGYLHSHSTEQPRGRHPSEEGLPAPLPNCDGRGVALEEEQTSWIERLAHRTLPEGREEQGESLSMTPQVWRKPSLFTEEILLEEFPPNFRTPHLGEYDCVTNLKEHMCKFENTSLIHQYTDAIKCRMFITTLVSSAQRWF